MTTKPEPDLKQLRQQIRDVDESILQLVARRLSLAREVAEAKLARGLPTKDYQVEKEVIERARKQGRALGIYEALAEELTQTLIKYSCLLQDEHQGRTRQRVGGKRQRILIVGGLGAMGCWMAQYFDAFGHEVEICDQVEPAEASRFPLIRELAVGAARADIIVLATPISQTAEVLSRLLEGNHRALIFDICSLKSPLLPAIEDAIRAGLRVSSIHPMFGPGVDLLSGRNLILCETANPRWTDEVAALFTDSTLRLIRMPLAEHDEWMAYILGLSHLSNLIFAGALAESAPAYSRLAQIGSTTFNAQVQVASNVVRENQDLYFEIQQANGLTPVMLAAMANSLQAYLSAIKSADRDTFKRLMQKAKNYFEAEKPTTPA